MGRRGRKNKQKTQHWPPAQTTWPQPQKALPMKGQKFKRVSPEEFANVAKEVFNGNYYCIGDANAS